MFSEKYNYISKQQIQYESISDSLRCRIWNLFYQCEIKSGGLSNKHLGQIINGVPTIEERIADRLGFLIDLSPDKVSVQEKLKQNILSSFKWFEVYDFIDVYLSFLSEDEQVQRAEQLNRVLEQEKSGYRVVANEISPITNESEIQCIEEAIHTPYQSVNQHIQKALTLYSDLNVPDYENSIKESICAVEAMCCIITGLSGAQATLGAAIKKLKDSGIHIHGAMEKAFLALYGYASDESSIRHGGIDFTNAPAEDAKYMLVSCSAFVNYLIEKWEKSNT